MFSANVENSDRPAIKVQRFRLTYGRSGESSPGAHASSQIFHPQRKTFLRRVCVCVRAGVCFSSLGYICEVKLSSWQLQAADQRTPSCLSSRLLLEEAAEDGKKDEPEPGDIRTFFFFYISGGAMGGSTAEWACRPPPALSSSNSRKSLEAVIRNMKQGP